MVIPSCRVLFIAASRATGGDDPRKQRQDGKYVRGFMWVIQLNEEYATASKGCIHNKVQFFGKFIVRSRMKSMAS